MEQEQKLLEDIENRINECEHREKYLTGREEQLNVLLAEIIEKSRKLEQLLKDKQCCKKRMKNSLLTERHFLTGF